MEKYKKITLSMRMKGFTLIELIVVIAIIGILAAIVYANFGSARASARDEARKVTLKELQLAIELYKAQVGQYPLPCRGTGNWSGNVPGSFGCPSGTEYIVGLVPDYIQQLPVDIRSSNNNGFIYNTNTDRSGYKLMAHNVVERNLVTGYDNEFARCPRSFGSSYCGDTTLQTTTYAVYGGLGTEGW